ncbi:MAG: cytidine deaminase [Candidatus Baltobacteraceae bacterium]|jgi:cytidine deaminase
MPSAADAELLGAARAACAQAYAPYSRLTVGAALRCADGTIVTACNVENASYGLSMCAERGALFAAVAAGHRTFEAIAIAAADDAPTPPCGACRQVLSEFGGRVRVLYGTRAAWLDDLLPDAFDGSFATRPRL